MTGGEELNRGELFGGRGWGNRGGEGIPTRSGPDEVIARVHKQDLSGDPPGVGTEQKGCGVSHLGRLDVPAQRGLLTILLQDGGESWNAAGGESADRTGGDAVDPNLAGPQI